ncbi:MAG: glycoside hydrolase family 108 protein, partial [Chromatiaceae bacterium]|nr:glycoside hydrolase family 108 protein [Chromatiaceae bacterium]
MHTFPDCIAHVLAAEGGLVNDPKDPGGVTKFGISQRSYPALNIRALSLDEAKAIYQRDYWDKVQGEALPAGLDLLLLDHAVNAGPARAIRLLQHLVGVPEDGVMGPVTLAGVAIADRDDLIARYTELRLDFYRDLPTWRHFGAGWSRRVQRARRAALALA